MSVNRPYQLLNAWTNLYASWCVYHGTRDDLSGVLYTFVPLFCASVCVLPTFEQQRLGKCLPPIIARQPICKHVPAATNMHSNKRNVGCVCVCVRVCVCVWEREREKERFCKRISLSFTLFRSSFLSINNAFFGSHACPSFCDLVLEPKLLFFFCVCNSTLETFTKHFQATSVSSHIVP
jgi:hypothetical protein